MNATRRRGARLRLVLAGAATIALPGHRAEQGDGRGARLRLVLAGAATIALLGPVAWLWQDSLMPGAYSVMDMGYADHGGALTHVAGASAHSAQGHGGA